MWLAFLPTFLYWYFLLLQVFLKKVGIFTNYLEICLVRAVVYYYNYSPFRWVATPPPPVKNFFYSQCWTEETHTSKILLTGWGLWGFRGFSDASFLAKITAKKKVCYIYKVFVVVRMLTFWCGLIVYSI